MEKYSHLVACTRSQLILQRSQGLNNLELELAKVEQEIKDLELEDVVNIEKEAFQNSLTDLYGKYTTLQRQAYIK